MAKNGKKRQKCQKTATVPKNGKNCKIWQKWQKMAKMAKKAIFMIGKMLKEGIEIIKMAKIDKRVFKNGSKTVKAGLRIGQKWQKNAENCQK